MGISIKTNSIDYQKSPGAGLTSKTVFRGNYSAAKNNKTDSMSFLGKVYDHLTLIYTADNHRNIGRLPNLKSAVDEYKAKSDNPLVVSAGDYSMGKKGLSFHVDLMNKIGIQLTTLGNHEFFSGIRELANSLQKANFQTIVSNMEIPKENPLFQVFESFIGNAENSNRRLSVKIRDDQNAESHTSVIKEIKGKKYGFVGATAEDIDKYKIPMDGAKILSAKENIRKEVEYLQKQGIDRIILLSHLGLDVDREIAQGIPGIDVIVGGHTHKALPGIRKGFNLFETKKQDGTKEPVLILHNGAHNYLLGVSDLVFDEKGVLQVKADSPLTAFKTVKSVKKLAEKFLHLFDKKLQPETTNKLVNLTGYKPDPEMQNMIDEGTKDHKFIAEMPAALEKSWPVDGVDKLCSFIADATRTYTGADISIVLSGGIKRTIEKGKLTREYIEDFVIPFTNKVYNVKLTGKQILEALNHGADSIESEGGDNVLQVSGFKYTIDMNKPKGQRVKASQVLIQKGGKFEPLQLDKEYVTAYDHYLLSGGSGFASLKVDPKDARVTKAYNESTQKTAVQSDVLCDYISKNIAILDNLYKDFSDRIKVENYAPKIRRSIKEILRIKPREITFEN